jgi:hypothetical protein
LHFNQINSIISKSFEPCISKHAKNSFFQMTCGRTDLRDDPTTAIAKHYHECPAVACSSFSDSVVEEKTVQDLAKKGFSYPSRGSIDNIFKKLSESVHNGPLLRTADGRYVVVPADMPDEEKRLLIRILMSRGMNVKVLDCETLRHPYDDEIETPPSRSRGQNKRARKYGRDNTPLDEKRPRSGQDAVASTSAPKPAPAKPKSSKKKDNTATNEDSDVEHDVEYHSPPSIRKKKKSSKHP